MVVAEIRFAAFPVSVLSYKKFAASYPLQFSFASLTVFDRGGSGYSKSTRLSQIDLSFLPGIFCEGEV